MSAVKVHLHCGLERDITVASDKWTLTADNLRSSDPSSRNIMGFKQTLFTSVEHQQIKMLLGN